MKNKHLWILVGVIVLVTSSFLLLNFRLAWSSDQANKKVMTTNLGHAMPYPLQQDKKINIAIVGESALTGALQRALAEKIEKAGLGEIELVQEFEPAYQNPVLVVKVVKPSLIWTPLVSTSKLSIHAGYTSNGDATYVDVVENTHTSVASPDPTVLNMYAEYDLNDRSFGLISNVGYHQYLADYLAQEIVTALENLYRG